MFENLTAYLFGGDSIMITDDSKTKKYKTNDFAINPQSVIRKSFLYFSKDRLGVNVRLRENLSILTSF